MLKIRVLGQFHVENNGQAIEIPSRPAQSLLAYLVLNAGVSHRREKLAGLLWPDATEANARSYLRMALWRIRKSFTEGKVDWQAYLEINDISVTFEKNSAHWLDADIVLERKPPEDWSVDQLVEGVSVYLGELLPGFYDEWTILERERLRASLDHKMRLLLDRLIQEQKWDAVLDWSESWIALGHVPEPAYRALMIAQAGLGDLSSASAVYHRYTNVLHQELGVEPSEQMRDLYQQIERGDFPARILSLLEAEDSSIVDLPPEPGDPPYKGLHYFDTEDADLFFGREKVTDVLLQHLRRSSIAVVVGASGSGKSSIVRAGLVPALVRGYGSENGASRLGRSDEWLVHTITPTTHPLEALALSLTRDYESVATSATLIDDLASDPRSLNLAARRLLERHDSPQMLLVVDQFEELFTLCQNEEERSAFINNLLTAVDAEGGGLITAVIILRADFYGHCAQYAELRDVLSKNQEYMGPMNAEELRRAIEAPALQGGWSFQPGLVDLMLRDVGNEPGALPLLSHALLETWRRRRGRVMTLEGYAQAGSVRRAIARTAETVFNQGLTDSQQDTARKIFLRLTQVGEGSAGAMALLSSRRVAFSELTLNTAGTGDVQTVLNKLADARLITTSEGSVEVAHEALIHEWPRLRQWMEEGREAVLLHRHLTVAAQEWEAMDRDPGELYRGARLAQAREWASANSGELNLLEQEFLLASKSEEEQEQARREAQRHRELEAARKLAETERRRADDQTRSGRRLRLLVAGLSLVLLLALISAGLAIQQSRRAEEALSDAETERIRAEEERVRAESQARLSKSRELAAAATGYLDEDPELSILLSMKALSTTYTTQAENALHQALGTSRIRQVLEVMAPERGSIHRVIFSPDATRALIQVSLLPDIWRSTSTTFVRDINTGDVQFFHPGVLAQELPSNLEQFATMAFISPNRLRFTIYSLANGEQVRFWELDLDRLGLQIKNFEQVNLNPDGTLVALAMEDGQVGAWEIGDDRPVFLEDYGYDQRFTGCFDRARNWITSDNGELPVLDVTISPSGDRLAAAGCDGTARVWDLEGGEVFLVLDTHQEVVNDIAFSPDGKYLATASSDGTTILWDVESGKQLAKMPGHRGGVLSLAFDPKEARLATTGQDNTVKLWDLESGQELFTLVGHGDQVNYVAFNSDGSLLATGSQDGAVRVWDVSPEGPGESPIIAQNSSGDDLHLSTDGKQLATRDKSGGLVVYDANTGQIVCNAGGQNEQICPHFYSPGGHYLVTVSGDQTTKVWNGAVGEESLTLVGDLEGTAFSPSGERLVVNFGNNEIGVLELPKLFERSQSGTGSLVIESMEEVPFSPQLDGDISDLVFSPDGELLATAVDCGDYQDDQLVSYNICEVVLWDARTWQLVRVMRSLDLIAYRLNFSPDGTRIAVVGRERGVNVYDVATGNRILTLSDNAGQVHDVTFSPDGARIATAGADGLIRIWEAESGRELLTLIGGGSAVNRILFSPDGKRIYANNASGLIRAYTLDLEKLVALARGRVTRSLTDEECQVFLGQANCQ